MRKQRLLTGIVAAVLLFIGFAFRPEHSEPWTTAQLESPETLAKIIGNPKLPQPIIYSVGPGAVIKNSIDVGPAKETINLTKLKNLLAPLPKNASIVIYCGCCPFEHCPNIRPAFEMLNQMKFTNAKLLNIEHNVKTDWINKGYPVAQ